MSGPSWLLMPGMGPRIPRILFSTLPGFADMNGLGASMLVKLSARAKTKGQNLSAFGVSHDLRQVFKVTELDQAIQVHASETDALSAAGVSRGQSSLQTAEEPDVLVNLTSWAKPVSELFVPAMPKEARNLNVNGLRAVGPVNGFGRLCQKVFRLRICDTVISPEEAIAALKENFPSFQPSFNRFYPSPGGIQAGEIVLIRFFHAWRARLHRRHDPLCGRAFVHVQYAARTSGMRIRKFQRDTKGVRARSSRYLDWPEPATQFMRPRFDWSDPRFRREYGPMFSHRLPYILEFPLTLPLIKSVWTKACDGRKLETCTTMPRSGL